MSDIIWEFTIPRWPHPSYITIKSSDLNFAMRGVSFEHEPWRANTQVERIRNGIKREIEGALRAYFLVPLEDSQTLAAKIHAELLEFYREKGVKWNSALEETNESTITAAREETE